jgi:L-lactate dehydrogenase
VRRCRYRGDHRFRRCAKARQTRLDELNIPRVLKSIVPQMMDNGFKGIFLIATNPCDIITWQVWKLSGLPRTR